MAEAQSPLDAIDRAVLAQLISDLDTETAHTLVNAFVDELEGRISTIEAALASGNLAVLAFQAHAIKSTTGTYGAYQLVPASLAVEEACRMEDTAAALARGRDLPVLIRQAAAGFRMWLAQAG